LKNALLSLSLGAIGLSLWLHCYAAAPMKIATVAPVGDLVAEADAKIKSLDEALATENSYRENKGTTIPTEAGVLAVLAQAIAESEAKSAWHASAPDVRDGAISIATSKSYDDAKKGLAEVHEAHNGKAGTAKADHEWKSLCKLGSVMKEINKRGGSLRRGVKLKAMTAEQSEKLARDASVMAVLALAAYDDTHEVKSKKKEDIEEWQKYAKEFQGQMTAAAVAFKKQDAAAAADAWKKGNMACNDCHGKFRPNE